MDITDYKSRRNKILQSIVELYLEDAVPVSSRAVVRHARLNVSSATVRNIMSELEELGLIQQPHTSAGRIPSDKGYRYYVNSVMQRRPLTREETVYIDKLAKNWCRQIERVVEPTIQILTSLTNYCGAISFPRIEKTGFKRLELVPISRNRVLAVLITTSGFVRNVFIELDHELEDSELLRISNFLNSELTSLNFDDIENFLLRKTLEIQDSFYFLFKEATQILEDLIHATHERIVLEGISKMIRQPEFQDVECGRRFLSAIEQKNTLLEMFMKGAEGGAVKVYIGDESAHSGFYDCSIVISPYQVLGKAIGALGVIGPKRMDYAKAVSVVEYVAHKLSGFLDEGDIF
ncbi:MAG: heat-inducible transcription repressor HrcA [Candidatus Omnitrophica bacterium]|nr:heat-inducible transcription repressor HrcA [Candidatus Omnitrophota bacterium]